MRLEIVRPPKNNYSIQIPTGQVMDFPVHSLKLPLLVDSCWRRKAHRVRSQGGHLDYRKLMRGLACRGHLDDLLPSRAAHVSPALELSRQSEVAPRGVDRARAKCGFGLDRAPVGLIGGFQAIPGHRPRRQATPAAHLCRRMQLPMPTDSGSPCRILHSNECEPCRIRRFDAQ